MAVTFIHVVISTIVGTAYESGNLKPSAKPLKHRTYSFRDHKQPVFELKPDQNSLQ